MPKTCEYCGNNPVPHRMYWYMESLNIFLTPLRQRLLYNPLTFWLKRRGVDAGLGNFFLRLGLFLKILRWRSDVKQCKVRRAQVLWEEAEKRNIEMQELLFFGRAIDVYEAVKSANRQIGASESKIIFSGLPRPAGYINPWLDLMDDKWLFKKYMLEHGLPTPAGASCWSFGQARKFFFKIKESEFKSQTNLKSEISRPQSLSAPADGGQANLKFLIVKPRSGSRGRHSTTFVSSLNELKQAFKAAKQLCYWVMVEEQLFGPVYRATVINFELCGVLRGDPPQVAGDGVKSIAELISDKNQKPHSGVKDVVVDEAMKKFVKREMTGARPPVIPSASEESIFNYVPFVGEVINLSEKIGVNYGGSSSEDYDICHQDNKDLFVRAAKILNDPIVGFDFIIPDIAKSWKEQKCGFIEVNSLPFINLHHDPLLGRPRNAAAKVWDMMGF